MIVEKALKTIEDYSMVEEGDKIACAVSGGKDSTVLLQVLSSRFDVEAITFNPRIGEYSQQNLQNIRDFCSHKKVRLHELDILELGFDLKQIRKKLAEKGIYYNFCTICGTLKRGLLNKKALELKATKIATGHNLDDIAESFLMNELRGNIFLSSGLGPVTGIKRREGFVQRIKPLYFIHEDEIAEYSKKKGFPVVYDACPYSGESYRRELKNILDEKFSKEKKIGLVNSLLRKIELLQRNRTGEIGMCIQCGSPSSGNKCKVCSIMEVLK